jgi:arginine decarboxylase
VPLKEIKRALLELKAAGKLDRVRMMILTNCTFDGIVYHPQRVMEECLAIKPDLIFLWDEAWFAFARFAPTYRKRTGMYAAQALQDKFRSPAYAEEYAAAEDKSNLPDPAKVRIRVYATQSTHKTLTSLRQGSMIHVYDQDFHKVEGAFKDAYMTHTSTSPNYQILASLDIGRRQVELEGYELVAKQIELAFTLREKIKTHPLLAKWFGFLSMRELIPVEYRPSGLDMYYNPELGWSAMLEAWEHDEFVLDPTRLTLHIGRTGVDGDTFKKQYLMDRHGIQVNKTTMNSVLFMTNIGTTRSSVAHLIDALVDLANEFEQRIEDESPPERAARERGLERLAGNLPPLPEFSRFHDRFRDGTATPEGDARTAYFLGTNEENCEYFRIDEPAIDEVMKSGRDLVASSFLTPYPPGFPVLVPGQVVSAEILAYLRALDTKEIHGYRADLGIRVFTETALKQNA